MSITLFLKKHGARLAAGFCLFLTISCSDDGPTPPNTPGAGTIEGKIESAGGDTASPSVVSYESAHERISRLSNYEGLFLFSDAEAGTGRLWITPAPGYMVAPGQANPVDIFVPDGGVARVTIRLAQYADTTDVDSLDVGYIRVHALNGEAPATGILVRARDTETDDVFGGATIGESGFVEIALPAGNYTIDPIVPEWFRVITITPATVVVTPEETSEATIEVEQVSALPPGGLEIFVANPDSVPADGGPPVNDQPPPVLVTIERLDGSGYTNQTETDALGRAHFDVEAGPYRVAIEMPDGWVSWPEYPNPVEVQVYSAMSTWARFYLRRPIR